MFILHKIYFILQDLSIQRTAIQNLNAIFRRRVFFPLLQFILILVQENLNDFMSFSNWSPIEFQNKNFRFAAILLTMIRCCPDEYDSFVSFYYL